MSRGLRCVLALAAILLLGNACSRGVSTGQVVGGVGGGAVGGLIGSQFGSGTGKILATSLGVALGAVIGSEIGRYLDPVDKSMNEQAAASSYESNQTKTWSNPNTGNSGSVKTVAVQEASSGATCKVQESKVVLENGETSTTSYKLCEKDGEYYTETI